MRPPTRLFTWRRLGKAAVAGLVTVSPVLYGALPAGAATANQDQCANGSAANNATACSVADATDTWQNGDLNTNNAKYAEGEVVPFRAAIGGLAAGTHTVVIEYDPTKSGHYAYDFLTDYNLTVTSADPCFGLGGAYSCAGAPSSTAVPSYPHPPATLTPDNGSLAFGNLKMWGGTLGALTSADYAFSGSVASDSIEDLTVSFSTVGPSSNVVLAWGGHIASPSNWNAGGAASISGSPYHMKVVSLDASPLSGPSMSMKASVIVPAGGLTLTKTANRAVYTAAGQTITYTYTLTNSGNVTLYGDQSDANKYFTISDDHIGSPLGTPFACSSHVTSLALGASTTCTATYTTQAGDIPNAITNTAFATGSIQQKNGYSAVTSNQASATVNYDALTLAKTAKPTSYSGAGQSITYTYTLTNGGTATIYGDPADANGYFTISDDHIGSPLGTPFECSSHVTSLAPGASTTCTSTYTTKAGDVPNAITNTATATGGTAAVRGAAVTSNQAQATVTYSAPINPPAPGGGPAFTPAPGLSILKSGSPTTYDHVGQVITYTYTLKNTGNVALSGPFTVTDNRIGTFTCSTASTLAIASTLTCTDTYTITSADAAASSVVNSATGKGFYNGTAVNSDPATFSVSALHPAISITKTANPASVTPGGVVTFTYTVKNSGDTVLAPVNVTDNVLGPIGTIPSLGPGQTVVLTKTMTVSADSPVTNVGLAAGTDPLGLTVSSTATATISVVQGTVVATTVPTAVPPAVAPAPAPTPTPVTRLPFTGAPIAAKLFVGTGMTLVGWSFLGISRRMRRRNRKG